MSREKLLEAIEDIPDGDPDSLALYDDDHGHFLINSDEDDQDVKEIDEALEGSGYERDGVLAVPGIVQQNVAPVEEDETE